MSAGREDGPARPAPAPVGRSVAATGGPRTARRPSVSRLPVVQETSAGGLVVRGQGEQARAALIGRLDRRGRMLWSLPKGHVEQGESNEVTAVREVAEETGITGSVRERLGTIAFWFVAGGARVHKTVHHYLLVAEAGELSDEDTEVNAVAWVPLTELDSWLAHADERGLVADLPHLLAAIA